MNRGSGIRLLNAVVICAMAGAVVAAVIILGPPSQQRLLRLDVLRATDLAGIAKAVDIYANRHDALPGDLVTLSREPGPRINRLDPETQAPYEYATSGAKSYTLCAVFHAASPETRSVRTFLGEDGWQHGPGRHCFERKRKSATDPSAPASR